MDRKDEVRRLLLSELGGGEPLPSPIDTLSLYEDGEKLALHKFYVDLDKIIPWSALQQIQFSFEETPISWNSISKVVEILRSVKRSWVPAVIEGEFEKVAILFIVAERLFLKPEEDLDWNVNLDALSTRFRKFLGTARVDVGEQPRGYASYSDKKFLSDYQESVKSKDFRGIFQFLRALDRGGGLWNEIAELLKVATRIVCRIDVGLLAEDAVNYSPILMKIVIDTIEIEKITEFARKYTGESSFPLLLCLNKLLTTQGHASPSRDVVWEEVEEYTEIVQAVAARTSGNVVSYILDCLWLSVNRQSNAILSAFVARTPNYLEDYVSKIDFSFDDSGELSYSALLRFSEDAIIDAISVKMYHSFFDHLERVEYKYHLFIFTSYYNYLLRAVTVISNKSHETFLEMLEQLSLDLIRSTSSWYPDKMAVVATRWIYWVMCSKLFDATGVEASKLVYTYRIIDNDGLMKMLECTRNQVLVDFSWLRIFLEEPSRLNRITIPLRDKAIEIVWKGNE